MTLSPQGQALLAQAERLISDIEEQAQTYREMTDRVIRQSEARVELLKKELRALRLERDAEVLGRVA